MYIPGRSSSPAKVRRTTLGEAGEAFSKTFHENLRLKKCRAASHGREAAPLEFQEFPCDTFPISV